MIINSIHIGHYLTDTYISEENIFPLTIWTSGSSDLSRTTNAFVFYIILLCDNTYIILVENKCGFYKIILRFV